MAQPFHFRDPSDPLASSETDHRIANSLTVISSLVRLKATHPDTDDVRQFLLDVAARIDTVARLHRLLAHPVGAGAHAGVPLARFLRDVCTAMKDIAGSDERLRMSVDCAEALTLAPESALRVGLLTAELFSNAIKYAHPTGIATAIQVTCRDDGGGNLVFSFEDDGIGLPENFDPATSGTLGMRIVDTLSRQIGGSTEWQDLGIGLRFTCRFPAPEPPHGHPPWPTTPLRDGHAVDPDHRRENGLSP